MIRPKSTEDRAFLETLATALDARAATLRRDEYDTWRLDGGRGHIYGTPEEGAWYLYARAGSARIWNNVKARLAFGQVTQDGDDEGIIRFVGMPGPEQAEIIRDAIRLPKARHLSPEQRARLSSVARKFKPRGPEAGS